MNDRLFGQWEVIEQHHEGYLAREQFEEHQRILELNAHTPRHSVLGMGRALLQGVVLCQQHDRHVMNVWYPAIATTFYQLRCSGDVMDGGTQCMSLPGRALERRVVEIALLHLAGPNIRSVRELWRAQHREWLRGARQQKQALQHARERLDRMKRLLYDCDPQNQHARAAIEQDVEEQAKEVSRLEREASREASELADPFTEERWDQLEALCSDVRRIWEAPTTEVHDRKQLLRIIIEAVVIEKRDHERIVGRVCWAGGDPDTAFELLLPPYFHQAMWKLYQSGVSPAEIAERFYAMGGRTQQDNPWSVPTISRTLAILAKRGQ